MKRDKGSQGDYRGEKKLKARREFTFIYFMLDFSSPIIEWPEDERREEAMRYSGLQEKDIDDKLMAAYNQYDRMMINCSRSLKTLRAVEVSLDELDEHFRTIDFNLKDKKGELVHSPNSYLMNLKRLGEAYDAVDKFRKRVMDELKASGSIRGSATLGRKETIGMGDWKEKATETKSTTDFRDLAVILNNELNDEEDD